MGRDIAALFVADSPSVAQISRQLPSHRSPSHRPLGASFEIASKVPQREKFGHVLRAGQKTLSNCFFLGPVAEISEMRPIWEGRSHFAQHCRKSWPTRPKLDQISPELAQCGVQCSTNFGPMFAEIGPKFANIRPKLNVTLKSVRICSKSVTFLRTARGQCKTSVLGRNFRAIPQPALNGLFGGDQSGK